MIEEISHIAIAVNNFEAINNWRYLLKGNFKEKRYSSDSQQVDALVFYNEKIKIEFLKPKTSNSPISNFLKRNRLGGIHHISFKVNDFESNIDLLKKNKIRNITRDRQSVGVEKNKICFLNPLDLNGVLVEFEQK